ncbi:phage terminase large subunit [Sphingomonas sp. MMS24-JH45]
MKARSSATALAACSTSKRRLSRSPGNGLIAFAGLQDHTSESIKSYEGFDVAWVEEAQTVSTRSLNLLRTDNPLAGFRVVVQLEPPS